MRFKHLLWLTVLVLFSCKKEDGTPPPNAPALLQNGILVLNEGLFQHNNSGLSWVSMADNTINNEFFMQKTGRMLGDTGNDLKRYGSKIYVVVNVSSTIEVLDANTGNAIKQIEMLNGTESKQPRFIEFFNGKAFIVCFDGFVDVLDTTTLTIEKRIAVGTNPDGIVRSGNNLFVSNSGGLNPPIMDSTVSVIDGFSLTETKKIVVGLNSGALAVDDLGNVFVVTRGNYGSIPSRLVKIDASSLEMTVKYPFDASGIEPMNNKFLLSYYSSGQAHVALFNPVSGLIENPDFLNLNTVQTLYGVRYRAANNQIYVLDAMGYTTTGYVRQFNTSGSETTSFSVGLNPTALLFFD